MCFLFHTVIDTLKLVYTTFLMTMPNIKLLAKLSNKFLPKNRTINKSTKAWDTLIPRVLRKK